MAGPIHMLMMVATCYLVFSGSTQVAEIVHRHSTPKKCRELCQASTGSFNYMKEDRSCRRIPPTPNREETQGTEDSSSVLKEDNATMNHSVAPDKSGLGNCSKNSSGSQTTTFKKDKTSNCLGGVIRFGTCVCKPGFYYNVTSSMCVSTTFKRQCRKRLTCKFPGGDCVEGVCLCEIGYYYNSAQMTCVTKCDSYGGGMATYKGAGIRKHNDRSIFYISMAKCYELCREEKKFFCLTADYGVDRVELWKQRRTCHLSHWGYLDVPVKYREKSLRKYSLGQRTECK